MDYKAIIDITQELFSCNVYPGDPSPVKTTVLSTANGDVCNLTSFQMCAHNGTHIDAPFHFLGDGKTVDQMGLVPYVGDCYVARFEGDLKASDAKDILMKASAAGADKRILIAGKMTVTADSAKVFAEAGVILIGNESQTVGPIDAPMEVHLILLGKEITLLEGIVLENVEEGKYFLSCAPLNLGGCDGAPCRAYLIKE
ncbi:MAG: cyclase family protein [Clostridiales bacterium]|nr:cyclase family protein [Clostridiales bacterium]